MGAIEYNGYTIRQGKKKSGNNSIGVFHEEKLIASFKYPSYNLLERSKKIASATRFIDNLLTKKTKS